MRRMVFTGAELEADFPFPALAATDHVKLCLPDPATGTIVFPRRPEQGAAPAGAPAPIMRDYTIRRFDPAARELTLDFVVHLHGPAGQWAATAAAGAEIGVLGPRGSQVYPASCPDYLLVADETALPATERFLEELPAEVPVRVVALGAVPRELGGGRAAEIRWLTPGDPESDADAVVDAVAGLPVGAGTFTFGAGEAGVMRALRRHLRTDRGADAEHVVVRGYWRIGIAGKLPAEDDD